MHPTIKVFSLIRTENTHVIALHVHSWDSLSVLNMYGAPSLINDIFLAVHGGQNLP